MWLRTMSLLGIVVIFLGSLGSTLLVADEFGPPLPGTKPLTMTGDIASELVAGVDRFLLKQIDELTGKRSAYWKRDFSSAAAYEAAVEPNRKRLAHILGVRDPRTLTRRKSFDPAILATPSRAIQVVNLAWPAFGDVTGEGLLVIPGATSSVDLTIIVIPDADQSPEQLLGLVPGVAPESQVARRLAESGCTVAVPTSDRSDRRAAQRPGQAHQPRIRLPLGLRAGPAPDRLRGPESAGAGGHPEPSRRGERQPPEDEEDRDLRLWRRGGRSRCMPRPSTRGSRPSASAATSTTATTSGDSRSIGTSSACWSSSATPSSPRWLHPGR